MFGKATEILRVPELRKKIFWTLVLLFAYRLGNHILLPGVDADEFVRRLGSQSSGVVGILNALSGGALGSATVFSLGVMPYISASIVFSLLQKMVPALEQVAKEGQNGQRKINQWTRWATIPICIFQASVTVSQLLGREASGTRPLIDPALFTSFFYKCAIILILTAGTLLIMWIGEKISEHGIGQGTSMIIMSGIIARLPTQISSSLVGDPENRTQFIAEIIALFVLSVLAVVYFTKAQRRVPIQQAKLTRGRRQLGGARHFIPLKVSAVGVMPIIFAQTLFVVPTMIGKAPGMGFINEYLGYESFLYLILYTVLIFFFAFFWTAVMFQPKEMANNLKEHGSFIPGTRPGQRTADFLEGVMVRTTLVGAAFLAVIALLPQFANEAFSIAGRGLAGVIGGTSILITVGVCLDLVDKINAQLVMRNYEGFTSGQTGGSSSGGGGGGWARRRETGGEK